MFGPAVTCSQCSKEIHDSSAHWAYMGTLLWRGYDTDAIRIFRDLEFCCPGCIHQYINKLQEKP